MKTINVSTCGKFQRAEILLQRARVARKSKNATGNDIASCGIPFNVAIKTHRHRHVPKRYQYEAIFACVKAYESHSNKMMPIISMSMRMLSISLKVFSSGESNMRKYKRTRLTAYRAEDAAQYFMNLVFVR